jgi:hypothetical protein
VPVIRWLVVIVAAASLAGCAFGRDWVDMTGHKRGESRAESDYKACAAEVGIAGLGRNANYDQTEADRGRLLACMYSRGWRATSLSHL